MVEVVGDTGMGGGDLCQQHDADTIATVVIPKPAKVRIDRFFTAAYYRLGTATGSALGHFRTVGLLGGVRVDVLLLRLGHRGVNRHALLCRRRI